MVKKETHTSENAKLYELGFHILPTVTEDKVTDVFSEVTGIISNNNGNVVKSGEPKATKLAYIITKKIKAQNKRFDSAYFAWIKFEASSDNIENIKELVEANENILRYIIVKTVDDDEHSTAKLVEEDESENSDDDKESDSEKVSNEKTDDSKEEKVSDPVEETDEEVEEKEDETDSTEEEKVSSKKAPKNKKDLDEIDEAIDELVK